MKIQWSFCFSFFQNPKSFCNLGNLLIKLYKMHKKSSSRIKGRYSVDYEDSECHFTLKKAFTNAYAKDIKGFAASEKKCS